jgi:membrane protein YdbS with pleckstrin-like domain
MNTIERKAAIVMAWLQIAVGLIILGVSGYRFVSHGYSFEAVNIVVTFVLGIFLPLMALGKLIRFKKEERLFTDRNDDSEKGNN